jgi:hypothetical protein
MTRSLARGGTELPFTHIAMFRSSSYVAKGLGILRQRMDLHFDVFGDLFLRKALLRQRGFTSTDNLCSILPGEIMALTIDAQLGPLEITALLGKGGMSKVYPARDLKSES